MSPSLRPEPGCSIAAAAVAGAAAGVAGGGGALDELAEPLTPEPVEAAPEPPPPSSEPFAAPAPAAVAAAAVADTGGSAPGGKAIGVIVFEDGTSYTLDKDYIIGREPENDAAVVAGRAGPLVVDDAERSISRVHAELRLFGSELQIVDRGSTNGTYVWSDTNADWVTAGAEPGRVRATRWVGRGRKPQLRVRGRGHRLAGVRVSCRRRRRSLPRTARSSASPA